MADGAAGITAASSAGNVKGAAGLMKDVIIEMAKYDAIKKLKKSGASGVHQPGGEEKPQQPGVPQEVGEPG